LGYQRTSGALAGIQSAPRWAESNRSSCKVKLLAARFNWGDRRKISRNSICSKSFNVHLYQADERTTEIGLDLPAAIDNYAYRFHRATVIPDDVDGLLDTATTGDDIFHDSEFLAWLNLKAAAEDEAARIFFCKNVAFA